MVLTVKPNNSKYLLLGAGGLGLALRTVLYATGIDEKGLLVRGHWAETCLWILTAAAAAAILVVTRPLPKTEHRADSQAASLSGAIGCILAAAALLLCGAPEAASPRMGIGELAGRFAAAAALVAVGFCRFTGRKPFFLLHGVVCVYLALRTVCQYRVWSADPQLMDYCFYLGSYIALMLTGYQFAALDAGFGNPRALWMAGLASVYLCTLSLSGNTEPFFLLGCGAWVFTNLPRSAPRCKTGPAVAEEGA